MKSLHIVATTLITFFLISQLGQAGPKELGTVKWLRSYDKAIAEAERTDKPILILFQEVPGCQGCVNFGETTLSHRLIVDAIENHFVPLAIYNNKGGEDAKILKQFEEPAWNFQVMRFIDSNGKDIIPRKDKVWSPTETATRIIEALEVAGKTVPDYLRTVTSNQSTNHLKTAAFSMSCFWDGEAKLGGIKGVSETEAGWLDGHEVVKLSYDPEQINWPTLVKQARSYGCANNIYAPDSGTLEKTPNGLSRTVKILDESKYRTARASDQKRHLRLSKLKDLSLNPIQSTKVNAALSRGDTNAIQTWLSPSQLEIAVN